METTPSKTLKPLKLLSPASKTLKPLKPTSSLKTTLTKQKDTDFHLFSMLEDKDLLNLCKANPSLDICSDDIFWQQRFYKNFGKYEKSDSKTWKTFYLQMIYYIEKNIQPESPIRFMPLSTQKIDFGNKMYNLSELSAGLGDAIEDGQIDIVKIFLDKGITTRYSLEYSAKSGNKELVDLFLEKGYNDYQEAFLGAISGGHKDLVEFFDGYLDNWPEKNIEGLYEAVRVGNMEMVNLFIKKNKKLTVGNLNNAMYEAIWKGHEDIVKFFVKKGANNYNEGLLRSVLENRKDLVEYFIKLGANETDKAMKMAGSHGYKDLVLYFYENGVKLEKALKGAVPSGNVKMVKFILSIDPSLINYKPRIIKKMLEK